METKEKQTTEKEGPIFIASAPNAGSDDRKIAKKLLFSPWKWNQNGHLRKKIEKKFAEMHGVKEAFAFGSGRTALAAVLRAIPLKPGNEVITQAYTCVAVPQGIMQGGGTPVYADIAENSFNPNVKSIEKRITEKTRAVLVQHTFGEPAEIDAIAEFISEQNSNRTADKKIYLIEDCAHCLGGTYKGKRVGTWGDAAFFSFGQEKVISCTTGGMALCRDPGIHKALKSQAESYPKQRKITTLRAIFHPLAWNTINATYYLPPFGRVTVGRLLILLFRALGLLRQQAGVGFVQNSPRQIYRLSDAQSEMLDNQLAKLTSFIAHRRKIADIYNTMLPSEHSVTGKEHTYLRYPLNVDMPSLLEASLKKQRIIPGNWYSSPIHPRGVPLTKYGYLPGSCLNAERAALRSINLPTGPNVSEKDARKIASVCTTFLSRNVYD